MSQEQLAGNKVMWCNITIAKSSGTSTSLWAMAAAGFGANEDKMMERIIAWKIFKEKDTGLAAYWVGDDASGTVARAFAANEECSSADFPVYGVGLKTLFAKASADADITAGFYAIVSPTTP